MRGKIYRLSENEEETSSGSCLGTIISVGGKIILKTDNNAIRDEIYPLLEKPIIIMGGGKDGQIFGTVIREVKPSDPDFIVQLKYELLKKGFWLEVEE